MLAAPGHLDQVLDNVFSNALEASPDGGTITVRWESGTARWDSGQRAVVLSVPDEGPGMSDQEKSRAFDRFWRGQGDPERRARRRPVRLDQPSGIFEE